MKSSNPFMSSMVGRGTQNQGNPFTAGNKAPTNPYAQPGGQYGSMQGGVATAAAHQGMPGAANYGQAGASDRPITVDDVVTKTGITLAVIIVGAIVNYFLCASPATSGIGMLLTAVGAIGGLIAVLVSSFGRKYDSAAVTLIYAAFEGLFVGGFSFMVAGLSVQGQDAGSLIAQAVLGTIGVFLGMLFVYKTGAIRVTPKFTRFMVGALIGVLVLVLGNLIFGLVAGSAGPLRDGGPVAWLFSLVCIGLGALSFLLDFDQADKLVRAGAPSKMAWGVALGLAVTLVWMYTEILRLLSYMRN
ncbi:Bax inhibitor-1/YccA family protein [Corynebacterium heidelbergense]|uniref:Bax inhibitor-1/YccA family protein n=1 Tax=Corynebacterium heidelbergense TaxID=2055947 RepID=A0A364V9S2_9CORY|nr:Bax inhibitor-1/YccA family protein [Corynebacterium heidelbergense]RAV33389.1 hypothetical protein CWC39_08735 [Corynebacterium heidelbergense]WCZ37074.1 Bax inhibitor 1 like protein [Corynebacterium heidelbergense]